MCKNVLPRSWKIRVSKARLFSQSALQINSFNKKQNEKKYNKGTDSSELVEDEQVIG